MAPEASLSESLIHAGGGTTLVVSYLSLIPGFLPLVALVGLVAALLALPVVALALAGTVVIGPPVGVWRLTTRARRRRAQREAR